MCRCRICSETLIYNMDIKTSSVGSTPPPVIPVVVPPTPIPVLKPPVVSVAGRGGYIPFFIGGVVGWFAGHAGIGTNILPTPPVKETVVDDKKDSVIVVKKGSWTYPREAMVFDWNKK